MQNVANATTAPVTTAVDTVPVRRDARKAATAQRRNIGP
jgi:hypothetical protein